MRFLSTPILLVALVIGCNHGASESDGQSDDSGESRITIIATSYPAFEIASELAKDLAVIEFPVPEGKSTVDWSPQTDDVARLQDADVIIVHGLGLEPWLDKISLPASRVLQSTKDIPRETLIPVDTGITHRHGPEGQKSDAPVVAWTWLDPELLILQVKSITRRLTQMLPEHQGTLLKRETKLVNEIESIQRRCQRLSSSDSLQGTRVMLLQPGFGYLLRTLSWPYEVLDPLSLKDLKPIGSTSEKTERESFLIHSKSFDKETIAALNTSGVAMMQLDRCETRSDHATLIQRMKENLSVLEEAFGN